MSRTRLALLALSTALVFSSVPSVSQAQTLSEIFAARRAARAEANNTADTKAKKADASTKKKLADKKAKADKPNPRDLYILSQLYRASGQTTQAVATIQKLLNANPDSVEYLLAALGILNDGNQRDAARPFADRLLAVAPNDYRVVSAVAQFECQAGHPDRGRIAPRPRESTRRHRRRHQGLERPCRGDRLARRHP